MVIARLRREQPDNSDTMRVCDALERRLKLPDDTLRRAFRSEETHHSNKEAPATPSAGRCGRSGP
jgi:hypothetical protein